MHNNLDLKFFETVSKYLCANILIEFCSIFFCTAKHPIHFLHDYLISHFELTTKVRSDLFVKIKQYNLKFLRNNFSWEKRGFYGVKEHHQLIVFCAKKKWNKSVRIFSHSTKIFIFEQMNTNSLNYIIFFLQKHFYIWVKMIPYNSEKVQTIQERNKMYFSGRYMKFRFSDLFK